MGVDSRDPLPLNWPQVVEEAPHGGAPSGSTSSFTICGIGFSTSCGKRCESVSRLPVEMERSSEMARHQTATKYAQTILGTLTTHSLLHSVGMSQRMERTEPTMWVDLIASSGLSTESTINGNREVVHDDYV